MTLWPTRNASSGIPDAAVHVNDRVKAKPPSLADPDEFGSCSTRHLQGDYQSCTFFGEAMELGMIDARVYEKGSSL